MTFQFERMNLIYVIDTIQIKLYKKSRSMFFTVFHLDMLPGSFLISITDECFVFLPEEGDVIVSAYDTLVSKVTMTGSPSERGCWFGSRDSAIFGDICPGFV